MKKKTTNKYDYSQISIPKDVKREAENVMEVIGCRTMTSFATMAIKEYISKIKSQ